MMRNNPTLRKILATCVQAEYKVTPTPRNLTDTVKLYEHFNNLGSPVVKFYQDQCPVTKMHLDRLRMTFHEPRRAPGYGDFPQGHVVLDGVRQAEQATPSTLEQKLLETTDIDPFKLEVRFVTRNEDSMTYRSDKLFSNAMGVDKQGTEQQRREIAEKKGEHELQKFINLF